MNAPLAPVARFVLAVLEPVAAIGDHPAHLALLFRRLGFAPPTAWGGDEAAMVDQITTAMASVSNALQSLEGLTEADEEQGELEWLLDLVTLLASVTQVVEAVHKLGPFPLSAELVGDLEAEWRVLVVEELPGFLIADALRAEIPQAFAVLYALGVIFAPPANTGALGGLRTQRPVLRVDWKQLPLLIQDPVGYLVARWGWSEGALKPNALFADLQMVLSALDARTYKLRLSDSARDALNLESLGQHGLVLPVLDEGADGELIELGFMLAPGRDSADRAGLAVLPRLYGEVAERIPLGEDWALKVAAELDATGVAGVLFVPGQAPRVVGTGGADFQLGLTLEGAPPQDAPWCFPSPKATPRLVCRGFSLEATLSGSTQAPELALRAGTLPGSKGEPGLSLLLNDPASDGFLAKLVGDAELALPLPFAVGWSSVDGFGVSGELDTTLELPLYVPMGPIFLDGASLRVKLDGEGLLLGARVNLGAAIGPFSCRVEGMGAAGMLSWGAPEAQPANLGGLGLGGKLLPPYKLAMALSAPGLVGAGELVCFPEEHRYEGSLAISVAKLFSISAAGLLLTQMPDGGKGWSLLLSLTASFTPGIQLGFGFSITGFGGLIGVNRTIDVDAVRRGLPSGKLDAVLFPDPDTLVENAGEMLSTLSAFFPPARGQYVFGPMVAISWGPTDQVRLELGVFIEVPSPVRIVLLGQLSCAFPDPAAAVVQLNMDVLGVLDFGAAALSLDASLHHSHVAGMSIAGDMAFRAVFKGRPSFLMSVGGFHPRYKVPAQFAELQSMRRLSISLPSLGELMGEEEGSASGSPPAESGERGAVYAEAGLEAYFALTSNTLQMGARLFMAAGVNIGGTGVSIEGGAYFDALIQFSPFGLMVGLGMYLDIRAGGMSLLAVLLDAQLSGPGPWHVVGIASFKILGIKASFEVDQRFGEAKRQEKLDKVNVAKAVSAALGQAGAWREELPAGAAQLEWAERAEGARVLRPDADLSVRQSVAPLGVPLEHHGGAPILGERLLEITGAKVGGRALHASALEPAKDWFAMAQHVELSDSEKLSRPSFLERPGGVRLGTGGFKVPVEPVYVDEDWFEESWDPDLEGGLAPVEGAA